MDVVTHTVSQLGLPEILNLCATNRHFAQLCRQDAFWQNLTRQLAVLADANVVPPQTYELFQIQMAPSAKQTYATLWKLSQILKFIDFLSSFDIMSWTATQGRWVVQHSKPSPADGVGTLSVGWYGGGNAPTKDQCG